VFNSLTNDYLWSFVGLDRKPNFMLPTQPNLMNNPSLKLLFVAACSVAIFGCSKIESAPSGTATAESVSATAAYPETIPLTGNAKPGIEPGDDLVNPESEPDDFPPTPQAKFTVIPTPCPEYIQETRLFTIDHLEEGSTYHQLNNKNLKIAFFDGYNIYPESKVQRFKPSPPAPFGWTAHWGNLPDVESEHPDVLLAPPYSYQMTIALSKPCIEFGLELTPNSQNHSFKFDVYFGNYLGDLTSGYVSNRIETPSGAKRYAVRSTKKFTVITIFYDIESSANLKYDPRGIAIANIRYKLAK
jgi:hypothetical protein